MLEYIIRTLESIEVHGKDNLSKMLGCINALEELQNQMQPKAETETEEEVVN